jgi:pilus assembly protein TadC
MHCIVISYKSLSTSKFSPGYSRMIIYKGYFGNLKSPSGLKEIEVEINIAFFFFFFLTFFLPSLIFIVEGPECNISILYIKH